MGRLFGSLRFPGLDRHHCCGINGLTFDRQPGERDQLDRLTTAVNLARRVVTALKISAMWWLSWLRSSFSWMIGSISVVDLVNTCCQILAIEGISCNELFWLENYQVIAFSDQHQLPRLYVWDFPSPLCSELQVVQTLLGTVRKRPTQIYLPPVMLLMVVTSESVPELIPRGLQYCLKWVALNLRKRQFGVTPS